MQCWHSKFYPLGKTGWVKLGKWTTTTLLGVLSSIWYHNWLWRCILLNLLTVARTKNAISRQIRKHHTLHKLHQWAAGRTGSTPQASGWAAADASRRPGGARARTVVCILFILSSTHSNRVGKHKGVAAFVFCLFYFVYLHRMVNLQRSKKFTVKFKESDNECLCVLMFSCSVISITAVQAWLEKAYRVTADCLELPECSVGPVSSAATVWLPQQLALQQSTVPLPLQQPYILPPMTGERSQFWTYPVATRWMTP